MRKTIFILFAILWLSSPSFANEHDDPPGTQFTDLNIIESLDFYDDPVPPNGWEIQSSNIENTWTRKRIEGTERHCSIRADDISENCNNLFGEKGKVGFAQIGGSEYVYDESLISGKLKTGENNRILLYIKALKNCECFNKDWVLPEYDHLTFEISFDYGTSANPTWYAFPQTQDDGMSLWVGSYEIDVWFHETDQDYFWFKIKYLCEDGDCESWDIMHLELRGYYWAFGDDDDDDTLVNESDDDSGSCGCGVGSSNARIFPVFLMFLIGWIALGLTKDRNQHS